MNPKQQQDPAVEESDIFDSEVMQQGSDPQRNIEEAVRCSMRARGIEVEEGKMGEEWSFGAQQQEPAATKIEVVARKAYGQQGELLKESPSLFGGWEERYCVLKGQRFIYKEDKYPTSPNAGILNFNLLSCEIEAVQKGSHYVSFTYPPLTQPPHPQLRQELHLQGRHARGHPPLDLPHQGGDRALGRLAEELHLPGALPALLASTPPSTQKDYESEVEFREAAETGDIVLFRGKKNTSMMQRALTMDEFGRSGEK